MKAEFINTGKRSVALIPYLAIVFNDYNLFKQIKLETGFLVFRFVLRFNYSVKGPR